MLRLRFRPKTETALTDLYCAWWYSHEVNYLTASPSTSNFLILNFTLTQGLK